MSLQCRFEDGEPVGLFELDAGCLVYPNDREQLLCLHHAMKASPRGRMALVLDLTHNAMFTKRWKGAAP